MIPQWVRNLIDASVSGISALANAAMERILWLYNVVVTIGMAARAGWGHLARIAGLWRDATFRLAGKVYGTLWYIIHIRIPAVISHATENIIQWTAGVINAIDVRLTALITGVWNWTTERLAELRDFIRSLIDWLLQELADIKDVLFRAAELVFTLLTSPQRMAAWVAGALLQYVILFIWQNLDTLMDLFRQRAIHYAGLAAARIEQVLVRML